MEVVLLSVVFLAIDFYDCVQTKVSSVYDFIYLITQQSRSRTETAKSHVGEKLSNYPLSMVRVISISLKIKKSKSIFS